MRTPSAQALVKIIFASFITFARIAVGDATAQDRHVVVVVWDGMRPDFVSEQTTPTLWKLAQDGVAFRNHHSLYPSATVVNGTAINTGVYPNRSGILANHDYRPEIDAKKSIDVETVGVVRRGDQVNGGKYLLVPTIAELIRKSGGKTAIATAKTVGLLFDRHADGQGGKNIFAGGSLPHDAATEIAKSLGPFPPATEPARRDEWTAKALLDFLWHDGVPTFSLLWLSEPDDTEHHTAPGDPAAIAAMKSSDGNLARVLAALEQRRARSTTDVFVVSDHGFSTIARSIDVRKILRDAGLDAVTEFTSEPKAGQVMIVGNGGTVLFYVIGHDAVVSHRLVNVLQESDFAGVIFTREPMEGTFTLDKAQIDPPSQSASPARTSGATGNEHAPDVELAFRWNGNKNPFAAPGTIDGDWQRAAGKGTHATLSKFDMHNVLFVAGPDFRKGMASDLPSGNVDLAPTICAILKIDAKSFDGRVLAEAMVGETKSLPAVTETVEATRKSASGSWRQELQVSRVGSTVYLDQGNGGFSRAP